MTLSWIFAPVTAVAGEMPSASDKIWILDPALPRSTGLRPVGEPLMRYSGSVDRADSLQAARYRERHTVSGAKSDPADAYVPADMARTDSHQLRPVAADSAEAEALKVMARAHKTLIWERTRHVQRLRHALRQYFPAALEAFDDLTASDTLELLGKAPDPA